MGAFSFRSSIPHLITVIVCILTLLIVIEGKLRAQDNVITYDFHNTNLSEIPESILKDSKITELNLSYNQLQGVLTPRIGKMSSLKVLDVSNNNLTRLPIEVEYLSDLEILDVSHNQIHDFPIELGSLTKLKILNILGNPYSEDDIAEIQTVLPDTIIVSY